jgi:hypothetical protein
MMAHPEQPASPEKSTPASETGTGPGATAPADVVPAGRIEQDEIELSEAVTRLAEDDVEPSDRRRLLGRIVRLQVRDRGVKDLFKPKKAIQWIADSVTDLAPHLQIRDLETLRGHFGGLEGDDLAERLIRNASRVTAGIGAAGGGVAAIEWVATPSLLSAPVLLAAETTAVVAVEIKLIGELHEVYGHPVPGSGVVRAAALVQAWSQRKGINPLRVGGGLAAALGTAARKELRERLLRRFGRNLTTLGPFLTGAAVGGYLNRRSTLSLGKDIVEDLKSQPRAAIEGRGAQPVRERDDVIEGEIS